MAIVAEDGTGKSDAETYASVTEFDAFLDNRDLSLTTDTTGNKEALLRLASDYIETLADRLKGTRNSETQALSFPRSGVEMDSVWIDSDEIHQKLKDAQCQLAYDMEANDAFPVGDGREIIREKIDVIETEYSKQGSSAVLPKFSKFDAMFRPFLKNNGGLGAFRA